MEFLHSPHNDPTQIVLLLVISKERRSRIVWYDWNSANTLRDSQLLAARYPLPKDEQSPLLLIPLLKFTAFMLVCKKTITLYKDLLTGTPTRYVQQLDDEKVPEEPGTSRDMPLWTQWARPMRFRGHQFTQVDDAIYLCREDGIVQYLEIHNNVDHMLNSTHRAGNLRINADTSFASLDLGPNTAELIVVSGDGGEGGLWRLEPREDGPTLVDAIANWARFSNLTIVSHSSIPSNIPGDPAGTGLVGPGQQRILACTGISKAGAISELRYGIQASKLLEAANLTSDPTCDAMRSGVLGIWAFHGFFGDPEYQFRCPEERLKDLTYILISHPTQTSFLFMPLEQDPELVEDMSLNLSVRTIFAGITARGQLVQVTESSIILSTFSLPHLVHVKKEYADGNEAKERRFEYQGVIPQYTFHIPNPLTRIMAACIHNEGKESIFLAAVQRDGKFYIQLANIDTKYEPRGEPWLLGSQSSCIHLHKAPHALLALVATVDGKIQLFIVGERDPTPLEACSYTFSVSPFAICDSIAIITTTTEETPLPQHLIVCGLRNGLIQTLHYTDVDSNHNLTLCEELVIGNTSVTVISDTTRKSRVICHCEQSLCTLEYPKYSLYRAPARVCSIWMTDRHQPALTQGTLNIVTQAVYSWLPDGVPGLSFGAFLGIYGESLQVWKLNSDPEAQLVPHRLKIGGSPKQLAYSRYLNKLIVLYNKRGIPKAPRNNGSVKVPGVRLLQPSIIFRDLDSRTDSAPLPNMMDGQQEGQSDKNDELLASERKATEEFLGFTEWFPIINGDQYHFLVINTQLDHNSKKAGRLLVFKVAKQENGTPRLFIKKKMMFSVPAYCVAEYPDGKSIVYCSGNDLFLQSLDLTQQGIKLQAPIKAEMRSPVRYLTIQAPYIFLSSSGESLAIYKYENGNLVYQYGDQAARVGLHHIHVPEHSLILASDIGNTVVGLWQPPERRIDNKMTPLLEAILPSCISCLGHVTRPVWYRNPDKPRESQAIIGTSIDGTITQLDVLAKGWRVLRFIQNMAERNKVVCPFKGRGPFLRHVDPSTRKPHYMHINGDILQRVVERGDEQLIKEMLDVEPDLDSHTDFDSAEARWERFKELAGEAVDTGDVNWLANLVQWVSYRLQSAL